jgi:hypothetical protein
MFVEGLFMVRWDIFVSNKVSTMRFVIDNLWNEWLLVISVLAGEIVLLYSAIILPIRLRVYFNLIGTPLYIRGPRFLPLSPFFSLWMRVGIGEYVESRKKLRRRLFFGRERTDRILAFCQTRRSFSRESGILGKVETPTAAAKSIEDWPDNCLASSSAKA